MTHGAVDVVLHFAPMSLIVPVQQDSCETGKGPGMLVSGKWNSTSALWFRDCIPHESVDDEDDGDDDDVVVSVVHIPNTQPW